MSIFEDRDIFPDCFYIGILIPPEILYFLVGIIGKPGNFRKSHITIFI